MNLLPPPPPQNPPGQGSLRLRGQDPRDQSGGAGRWIPAIGGARSIRALPPGSGSRGRAGRARARRLCAIGRAAAAAGKGPAALRCAALLPPGAEAPGEGSAGPSSRPLGCTRSSASAQDTAPGKGWIPGVPELRRPSLGVALRPSLLPPPPKAEGSSGFVARSLAGAASGCLAGKFPLLPWHPALVAGGGLPLHPAGCSASPPALPCWPPLALQPLLPSPSGLLGSHEIAGSRQNWG